MKNYLYRSFIAIFILAGTLSATAQTLYWTGGSGHWNDPDNWLPENASINVPPIPDQHTNVVFDQIENITVILPPNAFSANFTVAEGSQINFVSEDYTNLNVNGSFLQKGILSFDFEGEIEFSGKDITVDFGDLSPNASNLSFIFTGSSVKLFNSLRIPNSSLEICADFDFNMQQLEVGTLHFCDTTKAINLKGSSIFVHDSFSAPMDLKVNQNGGHIMISPEANGKIAPGNIELIAPSTLTSTCGTGPGQISFTIDAQVTSDYNGQDVSCNDASDGQAFVSVIGGVGPFSFMWIGGPSTQTYNGLSAGTYTVIVTDLGQGITCADDVQLTEPSEVSVFGLNVINPTCAGTCNGSASPSPFGGTGGYTYLWNGTDTTPILNNLCEGVNNLQIFDDNGCVFDTTFTVLLNGIDFNLNVNDALCFGGSDGSASSNPSGGGGGPYSINWTPGGTGNSISGLTAGDYLLSVEDADGCVVDTTFTVGEGPQIIISYDTLENLTCFESNDGMIHTSIFGGVPPFSFNWTGPNGFTSINEDISGLEAGLYNLTITDDNGCQESTMVNLAQPDEIVLTTSMIPADCFGAFTGEIELEISGGTFPFSQSWTGPNGFNSTNEDLIGLEAGFYDVTVTDGNGCSETTSIEVTQPDEIQFFESITPITCFGDDDGAIELNLIGGTPPYSVSWVGPGGFNSSDEDISGLAPGNYDVIVNDANGCQVTSTFTIDEVPDITIDFAVTPITCNGNSDGEISATVGGGTPGYLLGWTGPNGFSSSNANITGLEPGTYELTVTDAAGCVQTNQTLLNEPAPISVLETVEDVSCNGFTDGAISITTTGGTPGYSFSWTGPGGFNSNTEDISGLEAGDYDLLITDSQGCQYFETFTVLEFPPIILTASFNSTLCAGENNGEIDLSVSGGNPGYNISWIGPNGFTSINEDISGLEPGTYTVTVEDMEGCQEAESYVIDSTTPILIEASFTNPVCNGDMNGQIDLTISGGDAPYSIQWNTSDTTEDLSGLAAGNYSVEVTDANSCTESDIVLVETGQTVQTIVLTDPPVLSASTILVNVACFGDTTGAIDLTITGGIPGYDIVWSGPGGFSSTSTDLINLAAGAYDALITDTVGCAIPVSTTLSEPAEIIIDESVSTQLCGEDPGSISLEISGGVPPYTVFWSGPNGFSSADEDIADLEQGTYTVEVIDDNGCTSEESYDITGPLVLDVALTATDLDCSGNDNGSITIDVSGGTQPYDFDWTGPSGFTSTNEDIFDLAAGSYSLQVTDSNNCLWDTTVVLSQPIPINVSATLSHILCAGDTTGAIDITAFGGTAPLNFLWTGPDGFTSSSEDISGLIEGNYTLNVTGQEDCVLDTAFTIDPAVPLDISINTTDLTCSGVNEGAIDLEINGGSAPYMISWTGPGGFTSSDEDLLNLVVGVYEVIITDANGCDITGSTEIMDGDVIEVTVTSTASSCDIGDGTATASVNGGVGPYSYEWTDSSNTIIGNTETVSNLAPGTYSVTASDTQGCEATNTVNIMTLEGPTIDGSISNVLCNGQSNGAIDITVDSQNPPYVITWSGPDSFSSSDEDISGLIAGTYMVQAVDDAGCSTSETFTVNQPDIIQIDAQIDQVLCFNDSTGAIDITVSGGTPNFIFNWAGPNGFSSASEDIDSLVAGTYTVDLVDSNGCLADTVFSISEPADLTATFAITDTICNNEMNGSIDPTVTGGTAPYTYQWTAPGFSSNDEDISGLAPSAYNLVVTDVNGCLLDTTVTIIEANELLIDIDQTLPQCMQNDGILTAMVTGGVENTSYSYFWYDVEAGNALIGTSQSISNVTAGIYYLEVFDDLGCSANETIPLSDDAGTLDFAVSDVLCHGGSDGQIDMTVTGATDPIAISWTGPNAFTSSSEDLTGLVAGDYTVQVIDALGCELNDIISVAEPDSLNLSFETTDIGCSGQLTGSITTNINGGAPNYNFSWIGPNGFNSSNQDLTGLEEGCYTLSVTDSNGCQISAQQCILAAPMLDVMATISNVDCAGDSTGAVDIEPSGGTPTYIFNWSGPNGFNSNSEDLTNLSAGTYNLVLTDDNGCSLDTTFTVSENAPFDISAMVTPPTCAGNDDGAIDVTISGGSGPISTNWTGPDSFSSSQEDIADLASGDYELTITDSLGCVSVNTIPVVEPDSLQVDADYTSITCNGANDGSITISITGGNEPYMVNWTGPNGFASTELELVNLEPGLYSAMVTDDNGCNATIEVTIDEPAVIDLGINEIQNESCPDAMDGFIDIDITGGVPAYNFIWSGPNGYTASSEDVSELSAGTYSVIITDSVGCTVSIDDITLSVIDSIMVSTSGDIAECYENGPYLIMGSSEGSGTDMEQWTTISGDTVSTNGSLEINPEPGIYEFIYTAQAGECSASDTVLVEIFELPAANAGEDEFVFVDEEINLGGSPVTDSENSVIWSPGHLLNDSTASNPSWVVSQTQEFILTVTSPDGCISIDTVLISIVPEIEIPSGFSPNGDGINEYWIIDNIDQYPSTVVEVYNRWGDLLFRSDGYTQPWDGKYEGNTLPVGTYYYVIDVNEPDFQDEITGPITILR